MPEASEVPEVPEVTSTGPTPEDPTPTGRDRLVKAMRRPARTQVVVAVLLALVGFAGVTQIRANQVDDTYAGYREQDLIDVLRGLAGTTQRTQAEIDRLTRTRARLLSATGQRQAALDEAQKQADNLSVLAGLVPVTGPGVRITITEETGTISVTTMLDTIEQLRTVGAEAIQVNGKVRVVADSSFDEGVGGIVADGQQLASPYVIDVIGAPDTLAGAVDFGLGPRKEIIDDGGEVTVQQLPSLDVTAVHKASQTPFAHPSG